MLTQMAVSLAKADFKRKLKMTDEDFVSSIIEKQEGTRADIRSLAEEVSLLREEVAKNTSLSQQIVKFQMERDKREAQQVDIVRDVARIAHSVTSLVEDMQLQNRELTGLVRELRLSISVDASMNRMIAKIEGVGVALDKSS